MATATRWRRERRAKTAPIGGINGDQTNNASSGSGAVYVFTRTGDAWAQQAYVKSPQPRSGGAAGDLFGYSLALSADGNTLGVGAFDESGISNVINGDLDFRKPGTGAVCLTREPARPGPARRT